MSAGRHGSRASANAALVDLTGIIKINREKAVLFHDGTREAWLPKSLIEITPAERGSMVDIVLPEWLALDKGLI